MTKTKIRNLIFLILMPIACFLLVGIFSFSNVFESAFALSGNGGIILVSKNSTFNMTAGSISGGRANNGGGVYVASGGTFTMSGGTISGNSATTNGNNIYNAGTFTMAGGRVNREPYIRVDENNKKAEDGKYILFGSFPKTIKSADVTIDETMIDENGYFLGSDGEKYAKISATPFASGYKFSNGTTVVDGSEYYFKVEPIKWKILKVENGEAIILTNNVIDAQIYDLGDNNYKNSSIRRWINGEFYQKSFNVYEKFIIKETLVDNSASTTHSNSNQYACENTNDYVWLLSYKDIYKSEYGFGSNDISNNRTRQLMKTDYSLAGGIEVTNNYSDYACWWTRSPHTGQSYYGWFVDCSGCGSHGNVMLYDYRGVAPAMTIQLSESNLSDYGIYNTGTMNLYGGNVYDDIYSSSNINVKTGCNIDGTFTLGDDGAITLEDYNGKTPNYKIKLSSTRKAGTLITFVGNTTEPSLSKLNISGFDSESFELKTQKDTNGNWTISLVQVVYDFPSTWKDEIASTDNMTTTVSYSNIKSIQFISTVPSGYTKIGKLSTGLPVYADSGLTNIAFVGKKIYAPEDSSKLLAELYGVTSINFETFDTSKVTDMNNMFYDCSLISLDLSNFDTSKVTNMADIFMYCGGLKSLDLSSFDTSNVTDMSSMFQGCSALTSLDVSGFNTSNVTNMYAMFDGCSGLTSLNLSNFNTSNVTSMSYMFYGCSGLTSLALSNFDTSKVTSMSYMFYKCSALTSLDLSNFSTTNVTNMYSMFWECSALTGLDMSGFNTSKVTNMNYMFYKCSALTSLDVSGFNTSNVTEMSRIFCNCSALTSLDVSGFDTSNVANMGGMFVGCSALTSLDLSNFDTSKVTYIDYMFSKCSALTGLDISSFNMSKVTNSSYMLSFGSGNQIKILKTPYNNSSAIDITTGSTLYNEETGEVVTSVPAGTTKSLTYVNENPIKTFPTTWKDEIASTDNMTTTVTPANLTSIKFVSDVPSGYTQIGTFSTGLPVYQGTTATDIALVAEKIYAPANSRILFSNLTKLTSIEFGVFDTSKATDMSYMFHYCESLTSLDLINFNTSKVTSMEDMFWNCKGLSYLDVSNFNTSEVTDMRAMFFGCSSLTSLDVSKFDTSKVTSMNNMFYGLSGLTKLNLGSFDTLNVSQMDYMLTGCSGLTSLDLRNFDTSKVTNMFCMFSGCSGLTSLNISKFNMTKVTDCSYMLDFGTSNKIQKLNTPYNNSSAIDITTGSTLYNYATGDIVTSVPAGSSESLLYTNTIPVANFPTTWKTEVADANKMSTTINSANLTSIKFVSSIPDGYTQIGTLSTGLPVYQGATATDIAFVAEKIYAPERCDNLFSNLTKLTSIKFGVFDTTNVTDMSSMFYGCSSLTSLDFGSFKTSQVEYMGGMFNSCSKLTRLDLRSFNTSIVTDMSYMFSGCSDLEYIDFGKSFYTTKVTNMAYMFNMCTGYVRLQLDFTTTNVKDVSYMFYGCKSFEVLDISSFKLSSVTDSSKLSNMLNFGSSNKIQTLKTPYNNTSAIGIITGETLYNSETGAVVTSVPANLSASITLTSTRPSNFLSTIDDIFVVDLQIESCRENDVFFEKSKEEFQFEIVKVEG